jgi:hypothetical protein
VTRVAERFKLAPRVTGSKWDTVHWSIWEAAKRARGAVKASDGTLTPRLTNREAVALVMALRNASLDGRLSPRAFPFWYQFLAVAYGWDPRRDTLVATSAHADKLYPVDSGKELWLASQRFAGDLDDAGVSPGLSLDATDFDDLAVQASVTDALRDDGANAQWVIGVLPACKDPSTGKPGKPKKNPKTGKWECEPVVVEVNPVATVKRAGLWLVAIAAVALYLKFRRPRNPARRRLSTGIARHRRT